MFPNYNDPFVHIHRFPVEIHEYKLKEFTYPGESTNCGIFKKQLILLKIVLFLYKYCLKIILKKNKTFYRCSVIVIAV